VTSRLAGLASLKLTLAGMVLLGAAALYARESPESSAPWLAVPLALLSVNLVAAILTNRRFRNDPPLLAFHICLFMIVLLAALGYLTRLEGRIEIAEGQRLDPAGLEVTKRGLWHRLHLEPEVFEQGRISVEYSPGVVRGRTRSEIAFPREGGGSSAVVVGDDRPLVVDGYRFYTTSNKGWAVRLRWYPSSGGVQLGHLHLPSFPFLIKRQSNRWQLPTGDEVELTLDAMDVPMEESWELTSARHGSEAEVVVRVGDRAERLQPGVEIVLDGGRLRYEGAVLWMGYRVSYDPTRPWLAGAAVAAVVLIAWHFRRTLWAARQPAEAPIEPAAAGVRA